MSIDDIITLDNNKEYLILDIISLSNEKYLFGVLVDSDDNILNEYVYLKEVIENNETYVEEVTDDNILKTIVSMFSLNYLNNNIDDEQED